MKDLIKEVALEVAEKQQIETIPMQLSPTPSDLITAYLWSEDDLVEFATAFLTELSKRAEAVATVKSKEFSSGGYADNYFENVVDFHVDVQSLKDKDKLFTFQPIHDIEAIENRVAEAICEMLRHKDKSCFGAHNFYMHAANCIEEGEWRKYK